MNLEKNIDLTLSELENLKYEYGTPYYIYDGDKIRSQTLNYLNVFKKYFSDFKQYYSVKALPNPFVLKLLKDCGMSFDCSSPQEIKIIRYIDNQDKTKPKSEIFYTSNYASSDDIKFALEQDCLINLDDYDGLDNLIESSSPVPNKICFRYNSLMNVKNEDKLNNFVEHQNKFGMDKETIIKAYIRAKNLGINNLGLHTMYLSNEFDISVWEFIIKNQLELVSELKEKYSIQIDFINIGGGFDIPNRPEEIPINLENFVEQIKNYYKKYIFEYNIDWKISLYTECSRFITGPYGYLVSSCKSIKKTFTNKIFYGLDDFMVNLIRPGMDNTYQHISIPRLSNQSNKIKANIVGNFCENSDWFCSNRDLPVGINKEDLFVIHNVGAHSFSMGLNYNSKLKSPELLKLNGKIQLIRKRETCHNLFGNSLYLFEKNNSQIDKFFMFIFGTIILLHIVSIYYVIIS